MMPEGGDDQGRREDGDRTESDQIDHTGQPFDFQLGILDPESAPAFLSEGEESGLEIDDRQSADIRQIFGTAFPQYLQPVEEILDQILSGNGDAESVGALAGMLSSLMAASSRMGFDNVHDLLRQLYETVSNLDVESISSSAAGIREEIIGNLLDLKDLAQEMAGQTLVEDGKRSATIFSALKGKDGVGKDVLRRLTAAGLVSVDQLRKATADEIAAVSGIDIASARHLLGLLARDASPSAPPRHGSGGAETAYTSVVPLFPASRAAGGESGAIESLHDRVLRKLRAEADVEASIEELKNEIRVLRSSVADKRGCLGALEQSSGPRSKELRRLSQRHADHADDLDRSRRERDALVQRHSLSLEAVRAKEARIAVLSEQRRRLGGRTVRLGDAVGELVDELGHLRRSIAKRRPG